MDEYEPITVELRSYIRRATSTLDICWWMASNTHDVLDLCDNIDAVHTQLERDYARLKAERDSMAAALDAAQGEHAYAPESHYMMLPKDADGKPIHVGDEVYHRTFPHGKPCKVCGIGLDSFFYNDAAGFHWFFHAHEVSHQQLDTWERILADAMGCDEKEIGQDEYFVALVDRCKSLCKEMANG